MKIKNTNLKNQRLVLNNEALIFDKDGIAEVKDEEGKFLENLPGYEVVEEKATKKTDKNEVVEEKIATNEDLKENTKEDAKKTVEKPKTSTRVKATKKVE